MYFQLYKQRGGDFPFFKGARYSRYVIGIFCVVLSRCVTVPVKVVAYFFESLMQKCDEGQNWGNPAKESIIPAAGTVLNEATNSVKQRGSMKNKMKNRQLNII